MLDILPYGRDSNTLSSILANQVTGYVGDRTLDLGLLQDSLVNQIYIFFMYNETRRLRRGKGKMG